MGHWEDSGIPDMPQSLQLLGLCFCTAPCSDVGASEAPSCSPPRLFSTGMGHPDCLL